MPSAAHARCGARGRFALAAALNPWLLLFPLLLQCLLHGLVLRHGLLACRLAAGRAPANMQAVGRGAAGAQGGSAGGSRSSGWLNLAARKSAYLFMRACPLLPWACSTTCLHMVCNFLGLIPSSRLLQIRQHHVGTSRSAEQRWESSAMQPYQVNWMMAVHAEGKAMLGVPGLP